MPAHAHNNRRRRQRRSMGTTLVTTAVVGYGAYRLAEWLWSSDEDDNHHDDPEEEGIFSALGSWMSSTMMRNSWGQQQQQQRYSPSSPQQQPRLDPRTQWKLRRQRVFKCREESIKACQTCWPALTENIEEMTNTSAAMRKLRDLRASKDGHSDDLWKEIYVETLTRFLSCVYAHGLWFSMSTVQIHYVGGRMFRQVPPLEDDEKSMLTESHQYMLQHGLNRLVPMIRKTILPFIDEWKATTTISKIELHQLIRKVQSTIDATFSTQNNNKYARNWIRFVLPDDSVDEVWDICQSPVWDDAHSHLLNDTIDILLSSPEENGEEEIAVAKHMAPLKKSCPKLSLPENYQRWIAMPAMLELGDVSFQ
ncbi:unnamed protein product [Cylindrotheca closterium]|uniref:Uncharacterized protein n=1 Tax=Cylindrotheca closterium TaxID=2856 RepID=A0AAD2FTD8_9STRA|nr:unnamed protein product [Cylindrotheca closterium]